jgi:thioredoxin reductase
MTARILIVDDSAQNLLVASRHLESVGHQVRTASGGEQALAMLGNEHFDLVILDVLMPGIGGFETCRRIRATAALAGRNVLVIGGGDAAFENALKLDSAGCRVTIAIRGPVHARAAFRARVEVQSIERLHDAQAAEILGDTAVRAVRFETPSGVIERPADAVVVKIGQQPNTEWCASALDLDAEGYIKVDRSLRSSLDRVWAAGDVARPEVPGIVVAEGQGALAAAAVRHTLEDERRT